MSELKDTIEEIGRTFNEFKKTVDGRVEALEKNGAVGDFEEKLEKMNDRFDELEAIKASIEELEVKGGRPGMTEQERNIDEHAKAFDAFLRKGNENGLEELQEKALSIGSDADGGFAVPETLDTEIEQLSRQNNPMRSVCRVIPVSNENYKKLVSLGGAASGWVGETAARPETNSPTLAELAPYFGEIYANPAATQKSLDDIFFNAESWLAEEVSIEFAEQENLAFTSGNGTNKPKGILDYTMATDDDDSRTFGEIQYRLTGTDGTLGANDAAKVDNLVDLTYDLKPGYRQGASFMTSRDGLRQARKIKDDNGNMIWQPSLVAGQPSTLLAYPILENEDMPAAAAESNSMVFGNFGRAYYIVDVRGTRVLRDPFTNKPYVHFYTTKRVGGFLVNSEAVKVLRFGNGA